MAREISGPSSRKVLQSDHSDVEIDRGLVGESDSPVKWKISSVSLYMVAVEEVVQGVTCFPPSLRSYLGVYLTFVHNGANRNEYTTWDDVPTQRKIDRDGDSLYVYNITCLDIPSVEWKICKIFKQ